MNVTPDNINSLSDGQVFVFGSNLSGRHGKGAAKTALKWGARYGQGVGLQGKTYAIPTKSADIKTTLPLETIKGYIDEFIEFAIKNPQLTFLVTEIGCGLAGLTPEKVAPMFTAAKNMNNIYLPARFRIILQN